jgi:hypothetical protein
MPVRTETTPMSNTSHQRRLTWATIAPPDPPAENSCAGETSSGSLTIPSPVPGVGDDSGQARADLGSLFGIAVLIIGSFKRTVFLPDTADIDNISASSKDGILEVTVPMLAEALPKKVTVNVEA